jgi:hypothetical protein
MELRSFLVVAHGHACVLKRQLARSISACQRNCSAGSLRRQVLWRAGTDTILIRRNRNAVFSIFSSYSEGDPY